MKCECVKIADENTIIKGSTYYKEVAYENEQGETIGSDVVSSIQMLLCKTDGTVENTYTVENNKISADTTDWATGEHKIRYKITYIDTLVGTKIIDFKTINVVV